MGKQINYYLEYDGFLKIAEAALLRGCEILKKVDGKIIRGKDISMVTPDCYDYFFHYIPAGEVIVKEYNGREYVDDGYTPSGNTLIEAGFSHISKQEKRIRRARLFVVSGYYDKNDEWIPRPDCMTKLYCALERVAKKVALRTESVVYCEKPNGEEVARKYINYISPFCKQLIESGYNESQIIFDSHKSE